MSAADAAGAAAMSVRSLHRWFPALTGYRFADYVRKRHLTRALEELEASDASVLEIALRSGYDSHEAFTRAFRREYGLPPRRFRTAGGAVHRTRKIDLVGEVTMGVLTKRLTDLPAVAFDGFRPEPETTALQEMERWRRRHPGAGRRVFGHNIDREGRHADDPINEGYRVLLTLDAPENDPGDGARSATIPGGTFVVTGIEGSFEDDPTGAWITAGWKRLQEMVQRNGITVHPSCRWYEEHLEPVEPGLARFDLYLEIVPGDD